MDCALIFISASHLGNGPPDWRQSPHLILNPNPNTAANTLITEHTVVWHQRANSRCSGTEQTANSQALHAVVAALFITLLRVVLWEMSELRDRCSAR